MTQSLMASDEPEFRTAAELAAEQAAAGPDFTITERPTRRYPRGGGVEYEGQMVFTLVPTPERSDDTLAALVESVLDEEPYTYGDWFDLPMPLYLVHDDETGDTFRVAVRDGRVEFHILPATGEAGLHALYDRLVAASDARWHVDRR
ncbi:hypothetical protein [Natronomonas sp. EA1]|uniref:hypothetical protein n=1 Tax=Natronomonas sp. EA1 TaxID=3421655 RepID=UPI003EBA77B8